MIRIAIVNGQRNALLLRCDNAKERGDFGTVNRLTSILMISAGSTVAEIANVLDKTDATIRCWINKYLTKGLNSLDTKKRNGRPPKLSKSKKLKLEELIDEGPEKSGFSEGGWNSAMIQQLILDKFGVLYSVHYLSELLKNLGFSWQKAKFCSDHHSKKERRRWIKKTWPKILKKALRKNTLLFFGDEASFPQWGSLSYTWARIGKQPEVKTSGKRRGYKVFGLIDYFTGKFFCKAQETKLDSASYIDFLKSVMKQTTKHIIIIQDGAKYHTSEELCVFFWENRHRISVYQLPTYSPDYNPIEKLWRNIKRKGVHLKYFPTFEDLKNKVNELLLIYKDRQKTVLDLFGTYTLLGNNV